MGREPSKPVGGGQTSGQGGHAWFEEMGRTGVGREKREKHNTKLIQRQLKQCKIIKLSQTPSERVTTQEGFKFQGFFFFFLYFFASSTNSDTDSEKESTN